MFTSSILAKFCGATPNRWIVTYFIVTSYREPNRLTLQQFRYYDFFAFFVFITATADIWCIFLLVWTSAFFSISQHWNSARFPDYLVSICVLSWCCANRIIPINLDLKWDRKESYVKSNYSEQLDCYGFAMMIWAAWYGSTITRYSWVTGYIN